MKSMYARKLEIYLEGLAEEYAENGFEELRVNVGFKGGKEKREPEQG